ncbi:hypothetical protein [Piscibacillus salipiscarius]|uniref:Saposin B type region 2 domain-containing protein n=1 Tax=Piscibacillus salipiscarius TaxID=299480 RepID=A0ABW5Q6Y8_9BACI
MKYCHNFVKHYLKSIIELFMSIFNPHNIF